MTKSAPYEGVFASVALAVMALAAACQAEDPGSGKLDRSIGATTPSSSDGLDPANPSNPSGSPGAPNESGSLSTVRVVAQRLGLPARFAIGTGNDQSGNDPNAAFGLQLDSKIDIHYSYLSGPDWPWWTSTEGGYVTDHAKAAVARGAVPMFTLYQATGAGEGDFWAFSDSGFMTQYWKGVRLLFQKLGEVNAPAIVHLEPDLWGSTEQRSENPADVPVMIGSLASECTDLPQNIAGMARCEIRLARKLAPKVLVGLSASTFGAHDDDGNSDPTKIGTYLKNIGAAEGDIIVVETLDRDAGCFEAKNDPNCQRDGKFYWDESNQAHPNFHDHLAWVKTIHTVTGKPVLWWQMPLGVPSNSAGSKSHYRDNRVQYLFSHVDEFVAAGGFGAVFGPGADNQTTLKTDGGQFANALKGYLANPTALP